MKKTIQLSICVVILSAFACNNTDKTTKDAISNADSIEAVTIDSVTNEISSATDSLEQHTEALKNEVDALIEELN